MEVELDVKYEAGHTYHETWIYQEDIHCPACGRKTVWQESGEGDYYQGATYMCVGDHCMVTFTMPSFDIMKTKEDKQRLDAIRGNNGDK